MSEHPPSISPDLLQGTPYRTIGPAIGRGGMAEVYEGEHLDLEKRVVIKVLHAELCEDPRVAHRLLVEARALSAIESPHIVAARDFGRTPTGRAYLVLERLEGRTLREELRIRGALPVGEAIGYVLQVLEGLGAAHRQGIIHRDIKPDNVFLCRRAEGEAPLVKLLDFGIAKVREGGRRRALHEQPTQAGTVIGTPRWMAPEQALCRPVDERADLYAVGLLLYTLIAGRGPFGGLQSPMSLLRAQVEEAPAPLASVALQPIPAGLDACLSRALSKQPEQRLASAGELAEALNRVLRLSEPARSGDGTLILGHVHPSPEAGLGPAIAPVPGARHLSLFVALTLGSAAIFFAIAVHFLGGR
ncbi:MAG: serine/threonine-protein kinase [Minicystis sp.]